MKKSIYNIIVEMNIEIYEKVARVGIELQSQFTGEIIRLVMFNIHIDQDIGPYSYNDTKQYMTDMCNKYTSFGAILHARRR